MLEDRTLRGFIAGSLAGAIGSLLGIMVYSAGLVNLRWVDFASTLIYGKPPSFTTGEIVWAYLVVVFFNGFLGAILSHLVLYINSNYLYIKGIIWFGFMWFFINTITTLFKVEGTLNVPLNTVVWHFIGAVIVATLTVYFLRRFAERTTPVYSSNLQPAMKPLHQNNEEEEKDE